MNIARSFWNCAEFELESREVIADFTQSYVVHGKPEDDGSNVVLVASSLGGNAHRLDFLIGNGLALDPSDLCVICFDAIGNGFSSSPSNSSKQPGLSFPQYNIRDMVRAQKATLSNNFGIERVRAVVGASMGGMQALQWAVLFPQAMDALVALVPLDYAPPWTVATNEISRRILMLDPAWNNGDYTSPPKDGWHVASAFLQTIAARSPEYIDALCTNGMDPIALVDQMSEVVLNNGFDANDWIVQTRAYDQHDLGASPGFDGDTSAALSSIGVPTLVMGPPLDLLNPVSAHRRIAQHIPKARYIEMETIRGHLSSAVGDKDDVKHMNEEISDFLRRYVFN